MYPYVYFRFITPSDERAVVKHEWKCPLLRARDRIHRREKAVSVRTKHVVTRDNLSLGG